MSLQRICEEVLRPYLVSINATDITDRLKNIEILLQTCGVAVPSIATNLEPEDLVDTNLPLPVLRQLAKAIREDALPRASMDGDALRPQSFDQVIGHARFKQLMLRAILAAKAQSKPMAHILLTGPRGLGKTTLALAIAHEAGANVKLLNGSQFRSPADISSEVLKWKNGDIIFIDEIHGMHKSAQETLYSVLEDQRLPVSEKRHGAHVITSVPAPKITVIGATTNPAKMLGPFRNRFSTAYPLSFYSEAEMVQIGMRSCRVLGFSLSEKAMTFLVSHSRDNPRTLNGFLSHLSNQAIAERRRDLNVEDVRLLMDLNGFDALGLQPFERAYLEALEKQGGTASLSTLASTMDMETSEVEETIEPWLIRMGWISKSSRGRSLKRSLASAQTPSPSSTEELEDEEEITESLHTQPRGRCA